MLKADYKNWVPLGMELGFGAAGAVLTAGALAARKLPLGPGVKKGAGFVLGLGAAGCLAWTGWCFAARRAFSYDGERKLSMSKKEGLCYFLAGSTLLVGKK